MRATVLKLGLFALCAAAFGVVALSQQQALAALRDRATQLRAAHNELLRLSKEHERLMPRQLSDAEFAQFRAAHAETERLRVAAAKLRRESERESPSSPLDEIALPTPKLVQTSEAWSNVGHATPAASFQTFLWAVTHEETENIAALIAFDPKGRALADALFARLPEDLRTRHGSPENIFATLLAVRLPTELGSAEVTGESPDGAGVILHAHLHPLGGGERDANFRFIQEADGWRMVVPASVVENYQQMLADPPSSSAAK